MPLFTIYDLATGEIIREGNHPTPLAMIEDGQAALIGSRLSGDKHKIVNGEPVAITYVPSAADVDNEMARRLYLPFTWKNLAFQVDERSQARITSMGAAAAAAIAIGTDPAETKWLDASTDFYWIAMDNSHVTMSAGEMLDFAMNAGLWVSKNILAASAIKQTPGGIPSDYATDARWPLQ